MTYTIAVCTVKTPDDRQRNCPKHVEFYSKNKFEILVHLVGFTIRIRHPRSMATNRCEQTVVLRRALTAIHKHGAKKLEEWQNPSILKFHFGVEVNVFFPLRETLTDFHLLLLNKHKTAHFLKALEKCALHF